MIKKNNIILIVIFLISLFLRLYKTDQYPTLVWDEAALGYNAYSISTNLKDEYGQILPLIFKSFGDYKPGLYVYLAVPFIKLFGLNELTTRLPSILIGSLIPILLYFLVKTISPKSQKLALICALVATFNPYNIHYSRMAWETNILTGELILAILFFYKFINNKNKFNLFLSAFIFGLTLYTYQAGKLISLLLIIVLFILNFHQVVKEKIKISLFFIVPLAVLTVPLILGLLFSSNANRLKIVSIFSYPRNETETQMIIDESNQTDLTIFHNSAIYYSRGVLTRYFNHFSPAFLGFVGDWQNARHSVPYIGVILYPSLIFLVIGFFSCFRNKSLFTLNIFFLLWLIIAPIPASFTRDSVQATRSMSFSIPLVFFISLGIFEIIQKYKSILLTSLIILGYASSFFYYSDLYLNHMVKKSPNDFLYGYKQAAQLVIKEKSNFDQIYFTDFYGQPYIYYLFYSNYSPLKYQSMAKLNENTSGDTGTISNIENIYFESTNWQKVNNKPKTLAIFSYDEILRQNLHNNSDFKTKFIPISTIGDHSTFYVYQN